MCATPRALLLSPHNELWFQRCPPCSVPVRTCCQLSLSLPVNASTRLQRSGLKWFMGRITFSSCLGAKQRARNNLSYANTFIFLYDSGDGSRMANARYVHL